MNNIYIRDLIEPAFLHEVKHMAFSIVIQKVLHQIPREKFRRMKSFFANRQLGKYATTKVRFNDIALVTIPSYNHVRCMIN